MYAGKLQNVRLLVLGLSSYPIFSHADCLPSVSRYSGNFIKVQQISLQDLTLVIAERIDHLGIPVPREKSGAGFVLFPQSLYIRKLFGQITVSVAARLAVRAGSIC